MNSSAAVRLLFLALFFATGASGLGYQVLWAKRFAAGIGHEFPAVLAVITAYMGGIAAGALLYARTPALQRSSRTYALLELAIGAWAAATVPLIPQLNRAVISLLGSAPPPLYHWFVIISFVFLALLPATAAMGASFPAVEQFLASAQKRGPVAPLYAANTAGAVVGIALSAFWLMPRLGLARAILIFAAINLACGFLALAFSRNKRKPLPPAKTNHDYTLATRLVVTGLLGIGFETAMIRGLSQVLENTVFTFAALLAAYLGATALGVALWQRIRADLRVLFALLALFCCGAGLILRALPSFYPALRRAFGDSMAAVAFAEIISTSLVIFPPALLMGATFAALAERSLQSRPNLGWSVALNTAGAALAPGIFGLLLLPHLGVNGTVALIAAGYAVLIGKSKWLALLLPIACAWPFLPSSADLLRLRNGEKLIFHREGAMASTAVIESTNGARVLKVNNRFQMGGTAARTAEERHAYIPLLLHPKAKRALFIGFGTGITFEAARQFANVQSEAVELLPEVVQASRLFASRPDATRESRDIHIADGRRFVQTAPASYDVIVADLFHPAADGAGFLYTKEHFAAVRARLADGGLFCQWIPLFQLDLDTFRTIARTFLEVFPAGEAWLLRFNVDTPVIGLIAGAIPPGDAKLEPTEALRRAGLNDPVRLLGCHLAGAHELASFSSSAPLNTDDHPIVIFNAPRFAYRLQDDPGARLVKLLSELGSTNAPAWLQDSALAARLEQFKLARNLYLEALVLERFEPAKAAALHLASARASADFTASYAQVLTLATSLAQSNPAAARRLLEELNAARPELPVARQLLERLFGSAR